MSNLIPIEFKNQRILFTEHLAEVYQTDINNIQANFSRNKNRFKEGVHYYLLQGNDLKKFKNQPTISQMVSKHASQLYLWTERGANRHCKILDTDKAWEQFDNLEETYFKVKENKQLQLSPIEQLKLQSQVLVDHETKIEEFGTELKDLKNNLPLFNIECKELQSAVRKIGIKTLGGKNAPAYNDNSLRMKVYIDIQHQLKREFGVTKYEAIKRCQFETAKKIVEEYSVPLILTEQIKLLNSQVQM